MFEKNQYQIYIDGEEIAVSKEVYLAFMRPIWAERKRLERESRCRNSKGVRCYDDCRLCERARDGNDLSLERFSEDGYELADPTDIAELIIEKALKDALRKAIAELSENERRIIYAAFQEKTEHEAAKAFGIPRKTFVYRRDKIVYKLKKMMGL